MSHILDWFTVFMFIFIATIALERASTWFFDGFQKRGIEIRDAAADEPFSEYKD